MKSLKSISSIFSSVLFVMLFSNLAEGQETTVDKIIAKVDNHIVLKSNLDKAYLQYLSQGNFDLGDPKCGLLESLIVNKLLVAKAEIDSILVSDEEVNLQMEGRLQQFIAQFGSEEKLEEYYNKSIEQFKVEMFGELKEQLLVQRMQADITSDVKVTPADVKRFFKRIPKDSLPYISAEVSIAHIVKNPEVNKETKLQIKTQLNELRDQILAGEDFGDLAKKYSMDPGSRNNGGELGYNRRGQLAPEYESAALRLKEGEVSMPFETQFGIHIVQLLDRKGNQFKTRHILIIPQPSEEDYELTRNYLDSLKSVIELDSISFEKAAKEFSDDQFTSSQGGYLIDDTGSSRIAVDSKQMDPATFFTLDTMATGTITNAMEYQLPDGSKAFRILYYKDKFPPHVANFELDYQKLRFLAKKIETDRVLNEWFEGIKDEVFVEIDSDYQYCNILKKR